MSFVQIHYYRFHPTSNKNVSKKCQPNALNNLIIRTSKSCEHEIGAEIWCCAWWCAWTSDAPSPSSHYRVFSLLSFAELGVAYKFPNVSSLVPVRTSILNKLIKTTYLWFIGTWFQRAFLSKFLQCTFSLRDVRWCMLSLLVCCDTLPSEAVWTSCWDVSLLSQLDLVVFMAHLLHSIHSITAWVWLPSSIAMSPSDANNWHVFSYHNYLGVLLNQS